MATVVFKDGRKKQYRITLAHIGYARKWHHVEYTDFKKATAKILGVDVNEIERAYL